MLPPSARLCSAGQFGEDPAEVGVGPRVVVVPLEVPAVEEPATPAPATEDGRGEAESHEGEPAVVGSVVPGELRRVDRDHRELGRNRSGGQDGQGGQGGQGAPPAAREWRTARPPARPSARLLHDPAPRCRMVSNRSWASVKLGAISSARSTAERADLRSPAWTRASASRYHASETSTGPSARTARRSRTARCASPETPASSASC